MEKQKSVYKAINDGIRKLEEEGAKPEFFFRMNEDRSLRERFIKMAKEDVFYVTVGLGKNLESILREMVPCDVKDDFFFPLNNIEGFKYNLSFSPKTVKRIVPIKIIPQGNYSFTDNSVRYAEQEYRPANAEEVLNLFVQYPAVLETFNTFYLPNLNWVRKTSDGEKVEVIKVAYQGIGNYTGCHFYSEIVSVSQDWITSKKKKFFSNPMIAIPEGY